MTGKPKLAMPDPDIVEYIESHEPMMVVKVWVVPRGETGLGVMTAVEWRDAEGKTVEPEQMFVGEEGAPDPLDAFHAARHAKQVLEMTERVLGILCVAEGRADAGPGPDPKKGN